MKKILCALLSIVMILGIVACQTPGKQEPEVTAAPEPEKVVYSMERLGNPESGYDWYVSIADASVLGVKIEKEAIEPVVPETEPTEEPTPEPTVEPTPEPSTDRLYYVYSMDSEGLSLNLAQLYMFGIDVHDIYILMRDDGTATISFGDDDITEVEYDENSFKVGDEALNYTMDGDNILISIDTEHAVFAPADKVDEELKTIAETVSPIVPANEDPEKTEDPVEAEPEPAEEPTPEPTEEPVVYYDNTKYVFNFTGLKEGETIVRLDYQQVENGEVVSNSKHEAFKAVVAVEDGKMLVKMEEFEEDLNVAEGELESVPYEMEKEENASTGYSWSVSIEDGECLKCDRVDVEATEGEATDGEPVVGAPSKVKLVFTGLKEGSTMVYVNYARPWVEEEDPDEIDETYKAVVSMVDGKLVVEMTLLDNANVEDVDSVIENAEEAAKDAAEDIGDAIQEAAEKVEEAANPDANGN